MAKKINKKKKSLKSAYSSIFTVALIISISLVVAVLTLGILYGVLKNKNLLIALYVVLPTFLLTIIILIASISLRIKKIFFENLLPNTVSNYKGIVNETSRLNPYRMDFYSEISEVNDSIRKVNNLYKNIQILNKYNDYSHLNLEFFSKELNIITEASFKENIKNIIAISQSFRNGIVQIDYEMTSPLDADSLKGVLEGIKKIFNQEGLLISLYENRSGFYIYIPRISALTTLKENINDLFDTLTITKQTIDGIQLYSPKVNVVIYPYSKIDNIFSDLRYASSNEKKLNIYIPRRLSKQTNETLLHSTMNINAFNKIMAELSEIGKKQLSSEKSLNEINVVLEDLIAYLNIDEAGVVLFDADSRKYRVGTIAQLKESKQTIFPTKNDFPEDVIEAIESSLDEDGSFFFASRDSVNRSIGRIGDIYGCSSGFFFISNFDNGAHKCLVFFTNKDNKDLDVDSYIRESLLICSSLISAILTVSNVNAKLELMKSRENNLYKITNILSYNVNRNTYEILDYSTSLKDAIPNIQVGKKCYEAIFGLNGPCKNCPLVTRSKLIKDINGIKSEVSFSINNKLNNQVELLISPLEKEAVVRNRFEPDFGVNSLYSFKTRIDQFFLTKTKGYIVLLSIDNEPQLVKELGNEGFAMLCRLFTEDITLNVLKGHEIYLLKNDTLAIVLPEIGKLDVIDDLEIIHKLSKKMYLQEDQKISYSLAYSAIKFPQQYANSEDFIRHMTQVLNNRDFKVMPKETIYVEENEFYRPASRTDYILSIIDDAVENNKFIIKAQPVVYGHNKHIDGAELLIRLSDTYRDSMLNTDELVTVASKNNKLNLISDLLVDFVCKLYEKYGQNTLRTAGFAHISMNVEYGYFAEDKFIQKLEESIKKFKLPKGYMIFEITEKDFAIHYKEFMSIIPKLQRLNCIVACDRFTGQHLSIEKLSALHVDELKIDRSLINNIDVVSERFEAVKTIINVAKEHQIHVCAVGVENGQQYRLLYSANPNMFMQGYYFHHPLDSNELIDRIRKVDIDKNVPVIQ